MTSYNIKTMIQGTISDRNVTQSGDG
uniref:Uncharacterized protein n=1 Tax=Anguilla anguilla TaxID=7936 RepID=A0A0E9VXC8_ANGAN